MSNIIRQFFCLHVFEPLTIEERMRTLGAREMRICHKCGKTIIIGFGGIDEHIFPVL